MKGFQKLTLAAAIAAAPFAQAEMTSIDDALLSDMTGQAGITIDVDLQMTIDAIKYVDEDGESTKGAITIKDIALGAIAADGTLSAAQIRGVTIDADGDKGLVIGLGQIGDNLGNGIDIEVGAVLFNNGAAQLSAYNAGVAIATANATAGGTYTQADYVAGTVTSDMQTLVSDAVTASTAGEQGAAATAAVTDGVYADAAAFGAGLAAGEDDAVTYLAAQNAGVATAAGTAATYGVAGASLAAAAVGTTGNIGGIKIENFRNYLQDDIVAKYNGVFDMALEDSNGLVSSTVDGNTEGAFIRGEIAINGTGTYDTSAGHAASTGGLQISGKFGGIMDSAAWVDNNGGEFGVKDLGFFNAIDDNGDGISDTIEGLHFTVDIDVVDWTSSVAAANTGSAGGTIAVGSTVSALHLSNMAMEGTIMVGSIYVGSEDGTVATSLGSVLVKDIDMTGTDVYIYGH